MAWSRVPVGKEGKNGIFTDPKYPGVPGYPLARLALLSESWNFNGQRSHCDLSTDLQFCETEGATVDPNLHAHLKSAPAWPVEQGSPWKAEPYSQYQ
eukprot:8912-Rhodomonas_salina.1